MPQRSEADQPDASRSATYEVPIAASPATVWTALTDPRELERWFPLTAEVTPGVGGRYVLGWRGGHTGGDWTVLRWDPLRRLTVGMPKPAGAPSPAHVITDFLLEGRDGGTRLTVVASGFDADAEWDTFFHGVRRGWRYELRSLRHYLERHRGTPRLVAWARSPIVGTEQDAWAALFGPSGWVADRDVGRLSAGDHYAIIAPDGTKLAGTVYITDRPTDFTGTIEALNDALLRVQLERERSGTVASLWIAAYGVDAARMAALQDQWQRDLARTVGPASPSQSSIGR